MRTLLVLLLAMTFIGCSVEPAPNNNGNPTSDSDNDGVIDAYDECPDTPEGELAFTNGCSLSQLEDTSDEDNDGVPDYLDECPNTSSDDTARSDGCGQCQMDGDGDGIANCDDLCQDTIENVPVTDYGCLDTDGDGFADIHEFCDYDTDKTQPGDCGCGMPESNDCGGMIAFINGRASVTIFLDFDEVHEYWIILDSSRNLKYRFTSDHPNTLYAKFEVREGCESRLWTGCFGYNQETEEEVISDGFRFFEEGIHCITISRCQSENVYAGYYTLILEKL